MNERIKIYDALALRKLGVREGIPAMRGFVRARAFKRGRLIWTHEAENIVVSAHGVPMAHLLGGDVSNNSITAVGFGTNTAAPVVGDTALSNPAYYKAISSHSYPTAGQVMFTFSLIGGTDTGAYGMNVQEMALFCNTGAISLPVASAPPSMTMFAHYLVPIGVYGSSLTVELTWAINT